MKHAPLTRDNIFVTSEESFLKDANELVDIKQLEYLEEAIGRESFLEVANLYIAEARSSMTDILEAYESRVFVRIAGKSHSGKSGAATLGCVSLAETFKDIEVLAKQDEPPVDELGQQIVRLQALLDVSLGTLFQHLEPV